MRHLYIVTPTYARPEQEAELVVFNQIILQDNLANIYSKVRLAQTLMHVHSMTWWVLRNIQICLPEVFFSINTSSWHHPGLWLKTPRLFLHGLRGSWQGLMPSTGWSWQVGWKKERSLLKETNYWDWEEMRFNCVKVELIWSKDQKKKKNQIKL